MRHHGVTVTLAILAICWSAAAQNIFRPETCGGMRWIPYEPATMSFGLTPEQAADRVRAWMQDPGLQLQVVGIATDRTDDYLQANPWPTWDWELQYMLEGSDGKRYFVRIHPWVSVAYYDISADTPRGADPGLYLTDAQRQAVAEAFARARVPDLWGLEHEQEHYGRVMARYDGVVHPLRCTAASVHLETGALIRCVMTDPGTPSVPLTPTVSGAAAQDIGISCLLQAGLYTAIGPSSYGNRAQHLFIASDPLALVHRLAWSVPLAGTRDTPPTADGMWYEHDVYVDAHTGEPFYIESYIGCSRPASLRQVTRRRRESARFPLPLALVVRDRELQTAMPPLLISGRPYVWAGWIRNPLLRGEGTSVEYSAGRLTVTRGATLRTFAAKAWGGGRRGASVPPSRAIIVGNRCYLSLEAARTCLTIPVSYDGRGRAVRFGSPHTVRR